MQITVIDDLHPEDVAMLQALYSRSPDPVARHLEKVKAAGSGKFMQSYYVGYNHKSIADCGSTTMFVENVSLLAAKAIQDWPLYSGQETSTRYLDMGSRDLVDPLGRPDLHAPWMDFYRRAQAPTRDHVRATYPRREGEKEPDHERAVAARTFDILRGFLPAGITTQLSWHSNLRQAADHLVGLGKHPLDEVRAIAQGLRETLSSRYPSSGFGADAAGVSSETRKDPALVQAREAWTQRVVDAFTYLPPPEDEETFVKVIDQVTISENVAHDLLMGGEMADLLATRPRGCLLPRILETLGEVRFTFGLDFGSFRDLQRHRHGSIQMPLMDPDVGFDGWYVENLPVALMDEAADLVRTSLAAVRDVDAPPPIKQYYLPLGTMVGCHVTWHLPAAVYVLELRSSKTVHPTLRAVIHKMIGLFERRFPGVRLHVDRDEDDWTVRRGGQTLTAKKERAR